LIHFAFHLLLRAFVSARIYGINTVMLNETQKAKKDEKKLRKAVISWENDGFWPQNVANSQKLC